MSDESYISSGPGGTSFVGPDAVSLFQAVALRSAISLLQKGIQPRRGFTMKLALALATGYTGKRYKRTQAEDAKADLKLWADTMSAALPKLKDEVGS